MRSGLPEIVGRENDSALIDECLQAALRGEGQVVVLSCEPGIG